VVYNFQTKNNEIKLLMKYENVTQEVLLSNAVLVALLQWRIYDVITQNGDYLRERQCALVSRNEVHYQKATSLQNST
jgi:hypothetical protein